MLGFVRDMISTWAALRGPKLPQGSGLEEIHIGPMAVVLTIPNEPGGGASYLILAV